MKPSIPVGHMRLPVLEKMICGYDHYAYGLHKGDLLVWKNKESENCYCPISITEDGIIWEKLEYAYHVCVYEGACIISDMVKIDGNFELPFIIRKRKLIDLSNPDFVIRFEDGK